MINYHLVISHSENPNQKWRFSSLGKSSISMGHFPWQTVSHNQRVLLKTICCLPNVSVQGWTPTQIDSVCACDGTAADLGKLAICTYIRNDYLGR